MEIKKVYKTSKGLFWTKEEAEKLKNREKDFDIPPRYVGGSMEYSYEPVREAYVLFTWKDQDYCIYGMTFELNPVEIR
jgi:hypothetical protein